MSRFVNPTLRMSLPTEMRIFLKTIAWVNVDLIKYAPDFNCMMKLVLEELSMPQKIYPLPNKESSASRRVNEDGWNACNNMLRDCEAVFTGFKPVLTLAKVECAPIKADMEGLVTESRAVIAALDEGIERKVELNSDEASLIQLHATLLGSDARLRECDDAMETA
ncbi:hypothetical protein FQN49_000886 [Arthroderma sp. PD_2]|nr:hypothetical protein FQN49_000886 [Arthroderma sp. PD_2]